MTEKEEMKHHDEDPAWLSLLGLLLIAALFAIGWAVTR